VAEHRLETVVGNMTDVFSAEAPAALAVDPGDTVVVRCLDAGGYLEPMKTPGDIRPQMFPKARGHCLVGPIAVRGARPGMMLAVRLVSLRPDDWGWTVTALRNSLLGERLGLADEPGSWLLWDIDADEGTARNDRGLTVDLAPFLGVIGLPPAEPGEHSTIPPRACGGNIDCRELVAGSTLYLPVTVPDALLCIGDGHGAQGDGEVCGTAVECGMTVELVADLARDRPIPTAHAETPAGRITFGFSPDLNEASAQALDAMLGWMQELFEVDKAAALALASPSVHLRVTQVANQVWGVHALLPATALR